MPPVERSPRITASRGSIPYLMLEGPESFSQDNRIISRATTYAPDAKASVWTEKPRKRG